MVRYRRSDIKNRYDVVVIGSGLAGMTAANYVAKCGRSVLLLEQHDNLGGLATWPFHSWILTVIVTGVICIAYVALGRRYVHRWTMASKSKTNVDAIIGRQGIVLQSIVKNLDGRVKVGNEQWRARAEEDIKEGDEVVVTGVSGATLIVEKTEGGN